MCRAGKQPAPHHSSKLHLVLVAAAGMLGTLVALRLRSKRTKVGLWYHHAVRCLERQQLNCALLDRLWMRCARFGAICAAVASLFLYTLKQLRLAARGGDDSLAIKSPRLASAAVSATTHRQHSRGSASTRTLIQDPALCVLAKPSSSDKACPNAALCNWASASDLQDPALRAPVAHKSRARRLSLDACVRTARFAAPPIEPEHPSSTSLPPLRSPRGRLRCRSLNTVSKLIDTEPAVEPSGRRNGTTTRVASQHKTIRRRSVSYYQRNK